MAKAFLSFNFLEGRVGPSPIVMLGVGCKAIPGGMFRGLRDYSELGSNPGLQHAKYIL